MRSQPEISFSILASNLPMAMAFAFLNCYCDHMSNFKSFQVAHRDSVYTDRGPTQRLARLWGGVGPKDFFGSEILVCRLSFFFLVYELHQDFLGVAKIGWHFFRYFLSGAVLSINDFERNYLKLRYFLGSIPKTKYSSYSPYPPPTHPPTQANAVNSTCNIQSTRQH